MCRFGLKPYFVLEHVTVSVLWAFGACIEKCISYSIRLTGLHRGTLSSGFRWEGSSVFGLRTPKTRTLSSKPNSGGESCGQRFKNLQRRYDARAYLPGIIGFHLDIERIRAHADSAANRWNAERRVQALSRCSIGLDG